MNITFGAKPYQPMVKKPQAEVRQEKEQALQDLKPSYPQGSSVSA
jgi:hypothetical protein